MKMRKFVLLAMAALGATAAFVGCKKDDKVFSDPKIEFRDAENKVITEFTKENQQIKVLVTLGDKSLKIKKYEAKVVKSDGGDINQELKLNFTQVKGGRDDGKFEAEFTFAGTKIKDEKDPVVEVKVIDSNGKSTIGKLPYKAAGGTTTPTGTPMKNENTKAYVNHAFGTGTGAYSFSGGYAVSLAKDRQTDKEFVNTSEQSKEFKADFKSETGFKFLKLAGEVNYADATTEKVGDLAKKAKDTDIKGLGKDDLFVAVSADGLTYYLAKVTAIESGKFDFTYEGKKASVSEKGTGYMTFTYKSNK